jgi:hypothetical protein
MIPNFFSFFILKKTAIKKKLESKKQKLIN